MWDMTPYQGLATSRWVLDATTAKGLTIDTTIPGWRITSTGTLAPFPTIPADKALAVFLEAKDVTASGRSGEVSLNLGGAGLVWNASGMLVRSSAGTATSRDVVTTGITNADWGLRIQDGTVQGHFGGTLVEVPAGDAAGSLVPSLASGSNKVAVRQLVLTVVWPISGVTTTQNVGTAPTTTGGGAAPSVQPDPYLSGALLIGDSHRVPTIDSAGALEGATRSWVEQTVSNNASVKNALSTADGAQSAAAAAKSTADGLVPRVAAVESLAQDTAWRDITSLAVAGVVTEGKIFVRRTGPTVWVQFSGVQIATRTNWQKVIELPMGFRTDMNTLSLQILGSNTATDQVSLYPSGALHLSGHQDNTLPINFLFSFPTSSATPAPSTYPGSIV